MTPTDQKNFRLGETRVVLLISLLAAVHVFVFTAAFPFFGVVDEQSHIDLVVRYSQGDIPREISRISDEAQPFFLIYGTPEYLWPPATQVGGVHIFPPWKQAFSNAAPVVLARKAAWKNVVNHESSQPPLYYAVAGFWWRLGKALQLDGIILLYWLRFLNMALVASTCWLGWLASKKVFCENLFARLAVPALIAFMPQTAFYMVNNDILTPLSFGLVFFFLLKFWEMDIPGGRIAAATGIVLAATFLTKIGTLPFLAAAFGLVAIKYIRITRKANWRVAFPSLACLLLWALVPMAAWMVWCRMNYGDWTGTAAKINVLGWTDRPILEWLNHPLFTLRGFWVFVGGNLSTFWQGELLWHQKTLALPQLDAVYKIATIVLMSLSFISLVKHQAQKRANEAALWFSFGGLVLAAVFFAFLSVKYDFQDCFYPSRAHPYFTSGRLFLAGLIPIVILVVSGLDFLLQKFSTRIKFLFLGLIITFMLAGEMAVDWRVFGCEYNWYHL